MAEQIKITLRASCNGAIYQYTLFNKKSSGLKFSTSHSRSDVTYSCRHYSSCFTFSISVHSWHFSVFHMLQSITMCTYYLTTPIRFLNMMSEHELNFISFPRRAQEMDVVKERLLTAASGR